MCVGSVAGGTNTTLLGGQRHSEVHSLILLSIAVAAGDTHCREFDARHHCGAEVALTKYFLSLTFF